MAPFSPKTNCAHPIARFPILLSSSLLASRLITALKRWARVHDAHPSQRSRFSGLDISVEWGYGKKGLY